MGDLSENCLSLWGQALSYGFSGSRAELTVQQAAGKGQLPPSPTGWRDTPLRPEQFVLGVQTSLSTRSSLLRSSGWL